MSDIKPEDRLKRYSFNIDGHIIDLDLSDREIVFAINEWRRQGRGV